MWRIVGAGVVLGLIAGCAGSRRSHRDVQPVIAPPQPAPVAQGFAPAPAVPPAFPTAPPPNGQAPPPSTAFPTVPPPPGNGVPGPPPGPSNAFPTVPNQPFPTAPPPGPTGQIESNWQPAEARAPAAADNRVLLGPPEVTADQSGKDKKLYPPEVDAKPGETGPSASLPVGIPQFAPVKPQLATGRRPLDEGYAWLKDNRYRTVVHVRLPGENDEADRKQAEDRGLAYLSVEISPVLVTKDAVEEFLKIVGDPVRQPVFVYDRDGSLAGGLWYLYFRALEQHDDEVARIRARGAGLREEREGAHREMWQSVQKYLAENP